MNKKRKKKKAKHAWVLENTAPGPKANAKESNTNRIEARAGSAAQLHRILFTLKLLIEAAVVSGESA